MMFPVVCIVLRSPDAQFRKCLGLVNGRQSLAATPISEGRWRENEVSQGHSGIYPTKKIRKMVPIRGTISYSHWFSYLLYVAIMSINI